MYKFSSIIHANLTPFRQRFIQGFNLIEAAIVLGVVGLVIGGIWSAAAAVNETLKVNETYKGTMTIVQNVRNIFSDADRQATNYRVDEVTMQLAPADWIKNSSLLHPFGGTIAVYILDTSNSYDFNLYLFNLPYSACIKLVTKFILSKEAYVGAYNGTTWSYYAIGSQPPAAGSIACNTTGLSQIILYMNLLR